MRLELHVSMDGAALEADPGSELKRILKKLGARCETGDIDLEVPIRLRDSNGNRVGFAVITESDREAKPCTPTS